MVKWSRSCSCLFVLNMLLSFSLCLWRLFSRHYFIPLPFSFYVYCFLVLEIFCIVEPCRYTHFMFFLCFFVSIFTGICLFIFS